AVTARALRSLGFNVNFAPVLDLSEPDMPNGIGDRAYSADPGKVTALARVFAREHLKSSVLPVGKHFPGLGGARADTHETLPTIGIPRADLWRRDLLPYRRLRRALPLMMAGHAFYPALQTSGPAPASLSRAVARDLLRRRLDYRGLLLTDDLEMGAVDQALDGGEQALRAFDAGGDGLMFCRTRARILEAHARLRQAVADRDIDPRRLQASLRRIDALKKKHPGRRPAGSRRPDRFERAMAGARAAIAALGMDEARGFDPTART
ncbi:MAG: glycoside hydrolase family 3 N-terminal domain-containing protein, partial [Candidatus Polarisedimenticolia bacterium]